MSPCPSHSSRSPRSRTCKAPLSRRAWSSCSACVSRSCNASGRCHSSVLGFFCGGSPEAAAFAEAPTTWDGRNADFRWVVGGAAKSDGSAGAVEKRPQDCHRARLCQVCLCWRCHVFIFNTMIRTLHTTCVRDSSPISNPNIGTMFFKQTNAVTACLPRRTRRWRPGPPSAQELYQRDFLRPARPCCR